MSTLPRIYCDCGALLTVPASHGLPLIHRHHTLRSPVPILCLNCLQVSFAWPDNDLTPMALYEHDPYAITIKIFCKISEGDLPDL